MPLDAEELLHLAAKAMGSGQDAPAMRHLERAIALEPGNGRAHYLLGAVLASQGAIDRAVAEMTLAARFAPGLGTVHFQLGLLHFTSGRPDAAEAAWQPLVALGESDPLFHFRAGMLHLARDEFAACIASLERGIACNTTYPALSRDMEKVLVRAREAQAQQGSGPRSH